MALVTAEVMNCECHWVSDGPNQWSYQGLVMSYLYVYIERGGELVCGCVGVTLYCTRAGASPKGCAGQSTEESSMFREIISNSKHRTRLGSMLAGRLRRCRGGE